MHKHQHLLNFIFIPLLIFTLFLEGFPVFAQTTDSGNKIFISNLNCSALPTISMLVRGVDENGTPLAADIVGNGISVFENGQPITDLKLIGAEEAPKYVIFAFDRGVVSNLDDFQVEIGRVLQDFSNNYFKEGVDTVQFLAVTSDDAIASTPISTLDSFDTEIDGLDLSPTGSIGVKNNRFDHLDSFFKNLTNIIPGRYSMAVFYFTRVVEKDVDGESVLAAGLGTFLRSKNITIHVINTDGSGDANANARKPFELLATSNGGRYLPLIGKDTFPRDDIERLFQSVKNNTQSYRVQFPATILGAEYSVGPLGASATDHQVCLDAPELPAPEVEITQPVGANPIIALQAGQTTVSVQAALQNWDSARQITKVELLVNSSVVSKKDISQDTTRTTYALDWDLSQINITQNTTAILMVRVTDQFGMVGTSPEISVQIYPPPVATATPQPTGQTTFVPPPSQVCKETPFTPSCILETIQRNIVWILLGILVIVLIILFNTNRKLAAFASSRGEAVVKGISKGMEQVRKTLLGGTSIRKEAVAYLNVLVARADRSGGRIEIYNNRTTLGRDPKLTDIQLFNLDDQSSVSGLHCTIFFDQGKFFITDDNSSNGTFLNGKRLTPNDPTELPNNAEIILGDLYRQGAKLTFEIGTSSGHSSMDAYPEEEPDFHVDLSDDGSASYSPAPQKARPTPAPEDDFRKTIPGYREDMGLPETPAPPVSRPDAGNKTDIFYEPPVSPPPVIPPPVQPKINPPKKKGDDDWMKNLG